MKNKLLSRKQQRVLVSLLLALFISLFGAGYTYRDRVGQVAISNNPGLYDVASVADGDTIVVRGSDKDETVRFIGVDTPETHHPKKPVQCFGEAAANFTKNLIGNNQVRLEADPDDDNRDIYGRLLRYVYLPNGTLVNKEVVAQGYGFAYTVFPFTKIEEFREAEAQAREQKRGLWSSCSVEQDGNTETTNALP